MAPKKEVLARGKTKPTLGKPGRPEDFSEEVPEEEPEEEEVLNGARAVPWEKPGTFKGPPPEKQGLAEFEWLLDEGRSLQAWFKDKEKTRMARVLRGMKRAKNNEDYYHAALTKVHGKAGEAEMKLEAEMARVRELEAQRELTGAKHAQFFAEAQEQIAEAKKAQKEAERRNISLEKEVQQLRMLRDAALLREAKAAAQKAAEKLVQRNDAAALPRLLPWLESLGLAEKAPLALRYCGEIAALCLEDLLEHFEVTATGIEDFFRALNLEDNARQAATEALSKATKERRLLDQRLQSLSASRGHAADAERKRLLQAANTAEDEARMLEQKRNVDPNQLEVARAEAKRMKKKYNRFRSFASGATATWVVVSTPIFDMQGNNVFDDLKRLQKGHEGLVLANDWPNSTNARKADTGNFNRIGEIKSRWQDKEIFQEIMQLVMDTLWWNLYKGTVKGNLRACALAKRGLSVKAVCLDGGPVSRVEAHRMDSIVEEAVIELRTMGFDVKIEIERFASLQDFERVLEQQARLAAQLDSAAADAAPPPQLPALPATPPVSAEGLAALLEQQSKALSMLVESLWLFAQQKRSSLDKVQTANVTMLRLEAEQIQRSLVGLQWRVETTKLTKPLPDLEVDPVAMAFIRCSRSSSMLPLLPEKRSPSSPSLPRSPSMPRSR